MSDDPTHRPTEDRLRSALADHARTIEPSPDGLDRIEEELMTSSGSSSFPKWVLGGVAAAAALVVAIVFVASDDDDPSVVADSTTTTEESTTTTEAPEVDPFAVAYPAPGSRNFESAEDAARAYATDVLGFTDLEVGDYRAGDSRSGEVPVSDRPDGPETTVLVRQMEDDAWYVLASVNADIEVDAPASGAGVKSPFSTSGSALAFEGTVDVVVLTQDDLAVLGEGFVTGSGVPPAGPFEGEISFEAPADAGDAVETAGVLVYRTLSAQDGHVTQATSFPVRLVHGPS